MFIFTGSLNPIFLKNFSWFFFPIIFAIFAAPILDDLTIISLTPNEQLHGSQSLIVFLIGFDTSKIFGLIAVVLASVNIFGGFIVTYRMLSMFKKKSKIKKET